MVRMDRTSPLLFLELLLGICDHKLSVIYFMPSVSSGRFIDQVVQGTAEVVDNVSDESLTFEGQEFSGIWDVQAVSIYSEGIRLTFMVFNQSRLKLDYELLNPTQSGYY